MPHEIQPVRPGDLITAQAFNDLRLKIEELEQRIDQLQSGGNGSGLAITGRIPATGPYRIGETLTLLGRDFQVSIGAARVFLDSVQVLNLAGSTDSRLLLVIPPVPGVTEPGTEVDLRVLNSSEEVTDRLVLQPPLPVLFGEVDVTWLSVDPTNFEPGDAVTFTYRITSRASATADFLIDPLIAVAAAQSTWQSRLQVLDAEMSPIADRRLRLDRLEQRLFHVRITQVPTGTAGTPFQLTVNASAGQVQGTSGSQGFVVGEEVEPPDTTIELNPTQSFPNGNELVGDTVTANAGSTVRVRFTAEFEVPGTYDLTLETSDETDGWTVGRFLTTPESYEIRPEDIPAGGRATRLPEITIQPGSGASASGRVEVRLQRRGATGSRAFPLNLSLGA